MISHTGDNIGIQVIDKKTNKTLFYSPGLGEPTEDTIQLMSQSDCLLVDGTFWEEGEMSKVGLGDKKAADMGHLPQSGETGMIQLLRPMQKPRKVLIHINNTNPILDEDSIERKTLNDESIEVAYDGMDLKL